MQLNAVAGSGAEVAPRGGLYLPGDLRGVGPGTPAVAAAGDEDLLVVLAKREQHLAAGAVDHRTGVAAGAVAVGDDHLTGAPAAPAVAAAPQENVDFVIVAPGMAARLAKSQHRSVRRHGKGGYAEGVVAFPA